MTWGHPCVRVIGGALAVAALWGAARAEDPPVAAPPAAAPVPQAPPPGPIHVQMKEVEIRGEVERPEVFYIIPRKEAPMELGPLSKDFRAEIMEPLLPGPFEERVRSRKK